MIVYRRLFLFQATCLFLISSIGIAQTPQYSKAIEDNSFLIEEAYNQEPGVIQHVSNGLYYSTPSKDFLYSFTEEWPVITQDHQLSVSVPYMFLNSNLSNGLGDLMVSYRYQLTGRDAPVTLSPRFSLIIPTGNQDNGFGDGVWGAQFNLPMSKRISEPFVVHANAGFTLLPNVKSTSSPGISATNDLFTYFTGASAVWLMNANMNLMVEGLYNNMSVSNGSGGIERISEFILNPAIRYAVDVSNVQLVPGIGVPFTFSGGETRTGFFLYFSLEHPI
jgi:hypothetical protein